MNRPECEMKLIELLEQVKAVYEDYNPLGQILSISISNGCISLHDGFCDDDGNVITGLHTVEAVKFDDGEVWLGDKWEAIRRKAMGEQTV